MKFEPIVEIQAPIPEFLDTSLKGFNQERVKSFGFFHLLDKTDLFTPATLKLHQNDFKETLEWILWVKLPFIKFQKHMMMDG